ncbi:magnesium and cobalt transport [Fusarium sp. NRRL 52700]|nr:magnesium and cobalt transport [Fusarium sp. NRRL 52700]
MSGFEKLIAPAGAEDGIPASPELKETVNKIREYRDAMEYILGSYSYPFHPWQDRDHGWGSQLRVFYFDAGNFRSESPRLDRSNDTQQLWLDIEQALDKKPSENPPRSLTLMEGMDARIAEALGVKLDIPHEFWTSHYLPESRLRLINPSGFDSIDSTYWKVEAPSQFSFIWTELPDNSGNWYFTSYSGSRPRALEFMLTSETTLTNEALCISFWGNTLLTDGSSINRRIYPQQLSLWDVTVQAYENKKIITTDDPFFVTTIIRNFVLCKWEDQITSYWKQNQTVWTSSVAKSQKALDVKSPNLLIERTRTIAADYQKLRRSRQMLQIAAFEVRRVHEAFRCDDAHYLASQTIERLRIQISQESLCWSHLQDHIKVLDELLFGNMTMYAQRAAMDEAFATRIQAYDSYTQTKAANEQAAAVNPSILSMNGDFAAGEPLFYVYWCVAKPLTILLLGWVVQKDVQAWRGKLIKKAKREDDEKDVESSRNSVYYLD